MTDFQSFTIEAEATRQPTVVTGVRLLLHRLVRRIFGRRRTKDQVFDFCLALAQIENGPLSYRSSLTQQERDALWEMMEAGKLIVSRGSGTIEVSVGLRVVPLNRGDLSPNVSDQRTARSKL